MIAKPGVGPCDNTRLANKRDCRRGDRRRGDEHLTIEEATVGVLENRDWKNSCRDEGGNVYRIAIFECSTRDTKVVLDRYLRRILLVSLVSGVIGCELVSVLQRKDKQLATGRRNGVPGWKEQVHWGKRLAVFVHVRIFWERAVSLRGVSGTRPGFGVLHSLQLHYLRRAPPSRPTFMSTLFQHQPISTIATSASVSSFGVW